MGFQLKLVLENGVYYHKLDIFQTLMIFLNCTNSNCKISFFFFFKNLFRLGGNLFIKGVGIWKIWTTSFGFVSEMFSGGCIIYIVSIIKYPEKVNAFFQTLTCMLNSETDVEIHCLLLNKISKRYEKNVKYGHSSH